MVYVLVPGAWAADWIWDETASRLRGFGHTVHALTLSGLGGTGDAADVDLSTHVQDVLDHIRAHDLDRVVLVGHSYAGVVVGQVAASAPDLVAHTVYVNAFLPVEGRSLLEVSGLDEEHEVGFGAGRPPPRSERRADMDLRHHGGRSLADAHGAGRTRRPPARGPRSATT
jgi:pimeloyl-ACP methyl ester carboxylesterase